MLKFVEIVYYLFVKYIFRMSSEIRLSGFLYIREIKNSKKRIQNIDK